MATRTRVWLNSPYHNANDRYAYLLSPAQITEFEMYRENNVHINYADDLNMSCVTIPNIDIFNQKPNYCVIFNGVQVESHWFVTSYAFISGEQTSNRSKNAVTLSRDVVIDFKDNIKRATTKIQQGQIPDTYSVLSVANEPVVLNKVKTGEITIQDKFVDTEWAAIYYDSSQSRTLNITPDGAVPANLNYIAIQNSTFYGSRTNITPTSITTTDGIYRRRMSSFTFRWSVQYNGANSGWTETRVTVTYGNNDSVTGFSCANTGTFSNTSGVADALWLDNVNTFMRSRLYNGTFDFSPNGRLIEAINNYNFNQESIVTSEANQFHNKYVSLPASGGNTAVAQTTVTWVNRTTSSTNTFDYSAWTSNYNGSGQPIVNSSTVNNYTARTIDTSADPTYTVWEAPLTGVVSYSMLSLVLPSGITLSDINCGCVVVPFGDITVDGRAMSRDTISRLLTSSITSAGTDLFFDLQILPYCPVRYLEKTLQVRNINTSLLTTAEQANKINILSGESTVYNAFVVRSSNDGVIITLAQNNILHPTQDIKKHTIADSVRLVSPNNQSAFEITPTRNFGITEINIEWTVRPVKPFYRVYPSFGGLYGDDYDDGRGLFLEGGFSLSQVSSLWQNYQLNNSTYQQVFDREISSLELSNSVAQQKQQVDLNYNLLSAQAQKDAAYAKGIAGIVMGGVGGGVGGAMAGAKAGPVGAVVGGITGTIGGVAGGAANLAIGQQLHGQLIDYTRQQGQQMIALDNQLRAESISYKQDMFRLSNQAIIAKPNMLVRGSDLTINNRGKAYIELYSCTDEEWVYLDSYLKLRGHTIERFGALKDYLINDMDYIEATLLFIPGVLPHVSSAINAELNAGKFVQGGLFND